MANRVRALLSRMFEFAEERKMRPSGSNPCRGNKLYQERKVERFLSSGELARLGAALVALELGGLPDEHSDIKQDDSVAQLSDAKRKGAKTNLKSLQCGKTQQRL